MSTLHRWFRSGNYSLLGHTDMPQKGAGRLGVLIVPPFGWEEVCSYRPLRFLAQMLSAHGIPTLRFDLPGTGDSSGDARDPGLFEAWTQSVGDAAAELRTTAGVEDVAVVGIRLGAILATIAAIRGLDVQDLILWAPSVTGRAVLRELRAFSQMERREYAISDEAPPQPMPGFEVAGFLLAQETQRALEALDLSELPGLRARRILLLSRDDFRPDAKLISALKASGSSVVVGRGAGYAAMTALPNEARTPAVAGHAIVEFLSAGRKERTRPMKPGAVRPPTAVIKDDGPAVVESIYPIEHHSTRLFGILSEPPPETRRASLGVLFLNPGGVRHIGPNRMWVEAARRWAARGVPSLRLDLQGIGESDGEECLDIPSLYQARLVEQAETAKAFLKARLGVQHVVAIGLCSGAFWAFHLAIRHPDVRAAILLNPRLFFWDATVDRRRVLRHFFRWADWWRVARGRVQLDTFRRATRMVIDSFRQAPKAVGQNDPAKFMAHAWQALDCNQCRLTLVFTEGEPLLREMDDGRFPPAPDAYVRCVRIANVGHTFRPLWAQQFAHELIDRELDFLLRESSPGSAAKAS